MRVTDRGRLVEEQIDVEFCETGRDPVEHLIEQLRTATQNMTDVSFDVEVEEGAHGGMGSSWLRVSGQPTGELAEWARDVHEQKQTREREAQLRRAENVLRAAGRL